MPGKMGCFSMWTMGCEEEQRASYKAIRYPKELAEATPTGDGDECSLSFPLLGQYASGCGRGGAAEGDRQRHDNGGTGSWDVIERYRSRQKANYLKIKINNCGTPWVSMHKR